jgi:hypothetical protein
MPMPRLALFVRQPQSLGQKLLCAQPSVLWLPLIKSTLTKVLAGEGFAGPDDRIVGVVRFQNPVVTVRWHWPLEWRVGEDDFQLASQFGIDQFGPSVSRVPGLRAD